MYKYPRCNEFQTNPSDQGLCQTFNGYSLNKILKPSSWLDLFLEEFNIITDESIKQNYGVGMDNGLVFAVDAMTIFPISREDSKGNLKRLF